MTCLLSFQGSEQINKFTLQPEGLTACIRLLHPAQVHPAVAALTRSAGRVADDVVPYLTQCKAAYTLGCVAAAGAIPIIA